MHFVQVLLNFHIDNCQKDIAGAIYLLVLLLQMTDVIFMAIIFAHMKQPVSLVIIQQAPQLHQ